MSENMLRGSLTSTTDAKGVLGFKGERGYSAYEIDVQHGYEGTEEEWLEHLAGELSDYVSTDDVVDNLTSTYTTRPLSANQGKNLKGEIGDLTDLQTSVTTDLVSAINSVVESGSNTNGSYIKYADGTMICSKVVSGTTPINEVWGSGYTSGATASINLGDWAVEFLDVPTISVTPVRTGSNFWLSGVMYTTKSHVGDVSICRFSGATSVDYRLHIIGIGKWK